MVSEEKQAEIIRRVYQPGYAHAENILVRLQNLQQIMVEELAIDVVHSEVCDNPS